MGKALAIIIVMGAAAYRLVGMWLRSFTVILTNRHRGTGAGDGRMLSVTLSKKQDRGQCDQGKRRADSGHWHRPGVDYRTTHCTGRKFNSSRLCA
jgi:cation transport regulator ChaC